MQIEISQTTYDRLAKHVVGFGTPESVIIHLLDKVEAETGQKPILSFNPANENEFKTQLQVTRRANVTLRMADGSEEHGVWNARSFSETSNLRANLWSGYLRDWKKKGIISASFSIAEHDDSDNGLNDEVVSSAEYKNMQIHRCASGTIRVFKDGSEVTPVLPVLKQIADALGQDTRNGNGNDYNTRQLGDHLIKALNFYRA